MNLGIGQMVKDLRIKQQLTLKELSERAGLSTAYLSQFERGLTAINVDTLEVVAQALGVDIHYFIGTPKSGGKPVVHKYERQVDLLDQQQRYIHYNLSNMEDQSYFLPRYVELLPSANGKDDTLAYPHQGEEFLYILKGTMELWVNNVLYTLNPGDAAHYSSLQPHKWVNRTNDTVQLLTINNINFYVRNPEVPKHLLGKIDHSPSPREGRDET